MHVDRESFPGQKTLFPLKKLKWNISTFWESQLKNDKQINSANTVFHWKLVHSGNSLRWNKRSKKACIFLGSKHTGFHSIWTSQNTLMVGQFQHTTMLNQKHAQKIRNCLPSWIIGVLTYWDLYGHEQPSIFKTFAAICGALLFLCEFSILCALESSWLLWWLTLNHPPGWFSYNPSLLLPPLLFLSLMPVPLLQWSRWSNPLHIIT